LNLSLIVGPRDWELVYC